MGSLTDIVNVTISRETQSVARASFGTPAIISEFLTSKTTPAFVRHRYYASLPEMVADGWLTTDPEYLAASKIFSQNPKVPRVMIGRKDAADADWAAALNAVQIASQDWYGFMIIPDGTPATDFKAAADWAETQVKLYSIGSTDANILDAAATSDIAYILKGLGYERSFVSYHATAAEYLEAAWLGECLPFDPGSQTWAYKTLAGVTADSLTSAQRTAALAKNANVYTTTAGVSITERGQVASGEWIDVIRGLDWLQARLQEEIFLNLVNKRKIPYDDSGITLIGSLVTGVCSEAARKGILQADSIIVTTPKYATIPQADRLARNLPDVTFSALLLGAIQTVQINGTVTV